jgi:hypothetical protein
MSGLVQALIIAGASRVSEKMSFTGFFPGSDIEGAWFHFNDLSVVERLRTIHVHLPFTILRKSIGRDVPPIRMFDGTERPKNKIGKMGLGHAYNYPWGSPKRQNR